MEIVCWDILESRIVTWHHFSLILHFSLQFSGILKLH